jgi:Tfp pilus assembly protein FimT
MTTPQESQSPRERSWIYVTACVLLGVLTIWAIFAFSSARETKRAQDKADELIAALQDTGARTPDKDQIVRVLGDDGGATCENPNKALSRATLLTLLANGATGPGARPVIADSRAVQGQLLIMKIYCPDELADFQQFVDDLKTGDVASQ